MRPHNLDLVSLLPGLVFVALGTASLTGVLDVTRIDFVWLWPAVAILLGVLLLARLLPRGDDQGLE